MGIVSRMQVEARATSTTLGPPRDPVIAGWFGGNASATGLRVSPETSLKVTAVYRAINLLAQTYASLPLGVFAEDADGKRTLDKKHPNYRLLHDQPNKWQTSFEWREMMYGHFALRNRCYSEIISTGGRGVDQLIPLHPDRVRPFWAPDGKIAFEYTPLSGRSRVILQDEMHYMHGMSPDGLNPLTPIGLCREAIGLALATEEHGARLFGNGTRLGGLLKMPAGRTMKDDTKRKELMKSWKEAHSGLNNAYKTALLEDGLEWQELGMNSEDAQFIESRKFQIAEISRIWGVPLHKLGELDRSTNNNIEHQGIEWVQDTIRPGAARWEQAMKRDLFYGASAITHSVSFDLDDLMRGDLVARSKAYAVGRQWGWWNVNDIRAKLNENPIGEQGNVYMVPLNMVDAAKQTKELLDDNSKD